MAAGKRKAEGIALLSLYNDEDEEEDEAEEIGVASQRNRQEQEPRDEDAIEKAAHAEMDTEVIPVYSSATKVEVSETESLGPTLPVVFSQVDDDLTQSSLAERHRFFVDYAHDEGTLSPDAEEGEIMSTGRAVLSLGAQINNGFVQGILPAGLVRQEYKQLEDHSSPPDQEETQPSAVTPALNSDVLDQEMVDVKTLEIGATAADMLADFLPPPSIEECSQELQKKFAKFLAYKNAGRSFNEELRKSKGYRNPDFLQHAVKHQEIDQTGSCFSKDIFDPHGYEPSDFFDALALEYKREQERKEQAKKQSQQVDFGHGGVQAAPVSALSDKMKPMLPLPMEQRDQPSCASQGPTTASKVAPKSDSARLNKKSKWDKVETDTQTPGLMPNVSRSAMAAASAPTALLTAAAAGGYASFALQKRKGEERSRKSEIESERK